MPIGLFVGIFVAVFVTGFMLIRFIRKFVFPNIGFGIDELLERKEYSKAEKLISKKIMSTKDEKLLSKLHFQLGTCLGAQNEHFMAVVEYKAALKYSGLENESDIRFRLGSTLMRIGKKEEALAEYLILLKHEKVSSEVYSKIGRIYYENGSYDTAIEYLQKSVLDEKNKEAPLYLGLSYLALQNIPKAYQFLNSSMRYYSKSAKLRYYLGCTCRLNSDYNDAMIHLSFSAGSPIYEGKSYIEMALCMIDTNNINEAVNYFIKAISAAREQKVILAARYMLAECYENARDYKSAMRELEIIVSIDNDYRDAAVRLAKYKEEQQSGMVKEYMNADKDDFLRKAILIASVIEIQVQNVYSTQNSNYIILGELTDTMMTDKKIINAVYVSKSSGILTEEEIRNVYEFIRLQKVVKLSVVTTQTLSSSAASYAKQHYIDVFSNESVANLLQRTLAVSSMISLVMPKPKMLSF